MQGNPKILALLGELLANELSAINAYFVNSRLLANWGYPPLAEKAYEESMGEMRHAQSLMDRIIYFDAVPNPQKLSRVRVGATVKEQFELELELETNTRNALITGITLCRTEGDDGTRLLFEPMLAEGEATIDWLETQLGLIEQLGEQAYLSQQIRSE